MFLTFFGKPRWAASEHVQHALHGEHDDPGDESSIHEAEETMSAVPAGTGGYHPHESPWTMLVPLGLLSIGAIAAGMLFHGPFIEAEEGAHFWGAQPRLRHPPCPCHPRGAALGEAVAGARHADRPDPRLAGLSPRSVDPGRFAGQFGCSTPSSTTNGISTSSTTSSSSGPRSGSAACSGSAATKARSTASAPTAPPPRCSPAPA